MTHQSDQIDCSATGTARQRSGFLRYIGLRSGEPSNGFRDGIQNGGLNGYQEKAQQGNSDGQSDGQKHGTLRGVSKGTSGGSDLELALGLEFRVVDGVVLAYPPGHVPEPTAKDHAEGLLRWLQGQKFIQGHEVPARLIEDALYPHFCSTAGWAPYPWRTIATQFRRLPGVKRRQYDGRTGAHREGRMPIVYKVPRAKGGCVGDGLPLATNPETASTT